MRESEDHVEFKKGEHGNVSYNGVGKDKPSERRRCILGYVTALCNEGGGRLVIGMHVSYPHKVVGTKQCENSIGQLESDIYRDMGIRPDIYELYEDEVNKIGRVLVIEIPPHPIGKIFKFEDVALMRVGEELKPMDDKTFISIIQESEPDFSEKICKDATQCCLLKPSDSLPIVVEGDVFPGVFEFPEHSGIMPSGLNGDCKSCHFA